ncbi:MAG: CotH kinase family protein [Candidatus Zhuqueibacterota bacterium]
MKNYLFSLVIVAVLIRTVMAQDYLPEYNPVFEDSVIAQVFIEIDPDSLALILSPDNLYSDHEYPATFIFDNGIIRDTLTQVGFRLRGNTSRQSHKKSFKVSFNSFESGRKFYDVEKLNLNSEHNDPSIIRSKLCWDLFGNMRVPASRANHVKLTINGEYYGLYINVEHIDENFVRSRFGNDEGNLYKCLYPADLAYQGDNPDAYKVYIYGRRIYDLKTNTEADDYSDLALLIQTLHSTDDSQFRAEIERIFNVPSFLRALAVDILTGSWDDYWFWNNNYYLYFNQRTGKFEFIPYDYDNSFGIWWDGIMPGIDWGYRNVYQWGHPDQQRPLVTRILGIQEYRNRLTFYIRQLVQDYFNSDFLAPAIDRIHAIISSAAEQDTFRTLDYGFTIQDFHNSYEQSLGGHVPYGVKPYISTRSQTALDQLETVNISPIISEVIISPDIPVAGLDIALTARIEDEDSYRSVKVVYFINSVQQPRMTMYDDGQHGDGAPGDDIFGATIPAVNQSALIQFYIVAADLAGNQTVEPYGAPGSMFEMNIGLSQLKLFINEFMASNNATLADPFGDYDDWIEIYNGDTSAIWLGDKFLTDNLANPDKWALPDTTLSPGQFLLIWADDEVEQGPLHTSYKLDRDSEEIGLFDSEANGFALIDSVTYGYQVTDVSMGRVPDGGHIWQSLLQPSPGYSNVATGIQRPGPATPVDFQLMQNYPNPFNAETVITALAPVASHLRLTITNILGEQVRRIDEKHCAPGVIRFRWNGTDDAGATLASGVYFARLEALDTAGNRIAYSKIKVLFIQ